MKDESEAEIRLQGKHPWKYFRAGGVTQVAVRSGGDLAAIPELDLKLWAALEMPIAGLDIDAVTLALLDSDGDGRIRPPELCAAVRWASASLRDLEPLLSPGETLELANIADEGLLASARHILALLGRTDSQSVSLADVRGIEEKLAKSRVNGDGVVTSAATSDAALSSAIADIVKATGGRPDRSGAKGVDAETLAAFVKSATDFLAWAGSPAADPALLPLGADTSSAAAALAAVRGKVDDFFARAALASFEKDAAELVWNVEPVKAAALGELSVSSPAIAALPLAKVSAGASLPLLSGVNPAWEGKMAALAGVAGAVLGSRKSLDAADWESLKAKFAPYEAWISARPCPPPGELSPERLAALADPASVAALSALIAEDAAAAPVVGNMANLEKLLRLRRDLYRIVLNFVNFSDFYQKRDAAFQNGTLYLDARACRLCLEVADAGRHASLAGMAGIYLAYCEIRRKGEATKTIAAAFTDGDSDNLMVGRNGVFYDRLGRDWDATITKIIANPISMREAFWSPYKKLQRFIEEMVARRAADSESDVGGRMTGAAEWAASGKGKEAAPVQVPKKIDIGTVAALSVAFGAIGTMLSMLATGLMSLHWWQLPIVLAGILLLISTPSMVMAWLKLKRRNIAPLLDANGWAVNVHARINAPFGAAMTSTARIPARAVGTLIDPFAEKKSRWPWWTVFGASLILAIWAMDREGLIYRWTDGILGTRRVQVEESPAVAPSAPAVTPSAAPSEAAK